MYAIYNSKNHHLLTDHLEIHFIEIPKWTIKTTKEMNRLDRWLAYFPNKISEKELEEIAMDEPTIMNALQAEREFIKTPSLMSEYERREEEIRRYRTAISVSEANGKKIGREEGIAEANRISAIKLLANGVSVDIISNVTGLSSGQIAELKKEL